MVKNIIIGVLGVIVIVLSILGFSKYNKKNSVDIGLGVGNIGVGSGKYKGSNGGGFNFGGGKKAKTKKGSYIKCYTASSSSMSETVYLTLKNNKVSVDELAQFEISATATKEAINKYGKKYLENSLVSRMCYDKSAPRCGNIKFSWSGTKLTMAGAIDLHESSIEGLTFEEAKKEVEEENGTCEKVSKTPVYGTKLDPAGTYYNLNQEVHTN